MRANDAADNAAVVLLAPGASILGAPHSRSIGSGRGRYRPGGGVPPEWPWAPWRVPATARAQASPLFRLVQDHFRTLQTAYDERFAPTYGAWRAVEAEVADKCPACGVLEHGFARVPH